MRFITSILTEAATETRAEGAEVSAVYPIEFGWLTLGLESPCQYSHRSCTCRQCRLHTVNAALLLAVNPIEFLESRKWRASNFKSGISPLLRLPAHEHRHARQSSIA